MVSTTSRTRGRLASSHHRLLDIDEHAADNTPSDIRTRGPRADQRADPGAVRQSFIDASTNPELGALCGFGWDFCDITEIRTRDDSVVLTLQIDENRPPDDLPEESMSGLPAAVDLTECAGSRVTVLAT